MRFHDCSKCCRGNTSLSCSPGLWPPHQRKSQCSDSRRHSFLCGPGHMCIREILYVVITGARSHVSLESALHFRSPPRCHKWCHLSTVNPKPVPAEIRVHDLTYSDSQHIHLINTELFLGYFQGQTPCAATGTNTGKRYKVYAFKDNPIRSGWKY